MKHVFEGVDVKEPGQDTDRHRAIDEATQRELLECARQASERAYVPYSEFPVGAAALASDGTIHTGCNVENASYGLTICAERSAITAAVGSGAIEIVAIAVSAPKAALTTPCGACRQVLNEFRPTTQDMAVILDDRATGEVIGLEDLLPRAFGPRNLDAAALNPDSRI